MKKTLLILIFVVSLFSISGCSTILEPSNPEDSLLIGQLTLNSQGWDDYHNTSVNGVIKNGISMKIENTDTGEIYTTSTSSDGYFFKLNPKSGNYILKRLEYQSNTANSEAMYRQTLYWEPNLTLKYIDVEPGNVINLGSLTWTTFNKLCIITQDNTPEYLKESLEQKFPKSLWLQREWVNVKLFEKSTNE